MSTTEVPQPYLLDPAEESAALTKVEWASHEPLMFMRRRGGIKLDYADYYERYHRPENIELWAKLLGPGGMERLHFHKGMGLKTERQEIERTIAVSKKMHELGMKVSVYIGGTLHTDWFFKERPESKQWIAVTTSGSPITYMGYQLWRYFPCLNNQDYRAYVKEVLDVALDEVDADEIFFDNQILRGEPRSCRCQVCRELFPKYVEGKYTPEQRVERFGHPDVSGITPPLWTDEWPAGAIRTINDPVTQEWVDFRCRNVHDFFLDMRQYILSKKSAVSVGMNIKGLHPHNLCFDNGIDHGRWQTPGFNCCDAGLYSHLGPKGQMLAEFRAYKVTHTTALTQSPQSSDLDNILCLALNKQLEVPGFGMRPNMGREINSIYGTLGRFLRQHEQELFGMRPILMDVAVVRSFASMAYHCMNWINGPIIAEQALWDSRIPFGIIFDQNFNTLKRHKAILLCNQEALSDAQWAKLKNYVENGGGIVATDNTGSRDDWRRVRTKNALATVFGLALSDKASRKEFGKGRVAHIPKMVPAVEYKDNPLRHPYGSHNDCMAPKNWKQIEDALRWAAGGQFAFEFKGPKGIAAEFREGPTPGERVVHLLNFTQKKTTKPITITMAAGEKESWAVRILAPDGAPRAPLKPKKVKGGWSVTLKGMGELYAACVWSPV